MRLRAMLLAPLAVSALLASGVSTASAATLWTTSAHTTRVTTGATAVATGTDILLTSGTAVINTCSHAALNLTVEQNNDSAVVLGVTGSTWNGCSPFAVTGTHTPPWTLTISGTGFMSGAVNQCWNAAADGVRFDLIGGLYTGNLTGGLTVCQPTGGTSPLTLHALGAGTISGPLTANGRIDGTFDITGTAAAYSLTN